MCGVGAWNGLLDPELGDRAKQPRVTHTRDRRRIRAGLSCPDRLHVGQRRAGLEDP